VFYIHIGRCLAAGGVDYCSGLASFGLGESKCRDLVFQCTSPTLKPFIREGHEIDGIPTRRHVQIDLTGFMRRCRDIKPSRVRTTDIHLFNTELQRMIFCLLYFIGYDPLRPRSGPLLSKKFILGSCKTVYDFYAGLHIFKPVEYNEEFPDTHPRCNPAYTYNTKAAEILSAQYGWV